MTSVSDPIEFNTHTLAETISRLLKVYQPHAKKAGVQLTIQLDPAAATQPAGLTYTLLANALINAIDAAARSTENHHTPQVDVAITHTNTGITLTVSDTGPGIDPCVMDAQGNIRPGASTKHNNPGVGLVVCRQIAADLDGSLKLTNRTGGGAVFTMHAPRYAMA
ncbi:MAG: ATP-binding protein [Algisphaera sp.]